MPRKIKLKTSSRVDIITCLILRIYNVPSIHVEDVPGQYPYVHISPMFGLSCGLGSIYGAKIRDGEVICGATSHIMSTLYSGASLENQDHLRNSITSQQFSSCIFGVLIVLEIRTTHIFKDRFITFRGGLNPEVLPYSENTTQPVYNYLL